MKISFCILYDMKCKPIFIHVQFIRFEIKMNDIDYIVLYICVYTKFYHLSKF